MLLFAVGILRAQLPNGSTAPDWTLTDINGNSHHLYSYLDSGYTVFIDFSATWCGPCWNYHNSGALENLYNQYGPNGTNEVRVFFIEGDASTNLACLYGSAGCNSSTQGNWVAGTPYPIINDASQTGPYQVPWWPTIYGICSNHEITYLSQPSTAQAYAFHNNCPAPANLEVTSVNIMPVTCFGENTGGIDITLSGGSGNYTFQWDNGATTEDLQNVPAGDYSVFITDNNGGNSISAGPYTITQNDPIIATQAFYEPVTCGNGGNDGTVGYNVSGGLPGYSFLWSNGQTTSTLSGVGPGTYVLEITDSGGCVVSETVVFETPEFPTVAIDNNIAPITCVNATTTIDGSASSQGTTITYQWSTQDGNMVSGTTSPIVTVDAGGTYTLLVTNNSTFCESTGSIVVNADTTQPDIAASFANTGILTCTNTSVEIIGSSTTPNAVFSWIGPNGFSATTSTINVNVAGDYTLTVTDPTNGCVASVTVNVLSDMTPPSVSIAPSTPVLTCSAPFVTLTANSPNAATYEWTGPNNFTATTPSIFVNIAGTYLVTVTGSNGCINEADINVEEATPLGIQCATVSNVTTAGGSDGVGSVTVVAGSAPFTTWLNNSSQTVNAVGGVATYSNLPAGVYAVDVTDAVGCSASCSVIISEPNCDLSLAETHINESCLGYEDGSIEITPANGTGAITYSWSNGMTTQNISGLGAGTYTVFATDENSCQASLTIVIGTTQPVTPTFTQIGPLCATDSPVLLPTTDENGITGSWNLGAFDPANGSDTITFTPDPGQCALVTTMYIEVMPAVTPIFPLFGPYCSDDPIVELPNTSQNGITGTWTPSFFNPANGTQNAIFTPVFGQCAVDYDQEIIVENCNCANPPTADAGDPVEICAGSEVELAGSFGGSATMAEWSGGTGTFTPNNTTMNAVYTPSSSEIAQGFAHLLLTTDDPDGNGPCEAAVSDVNISIASPSLVLNITGEICCGTTVEISTSLTGCDDATYSWSTGDTLPNTIVDSAGIYSVTVTCGSGCEIVQDVEITECPIITEAEIIVTDASGETIADGAAEITNIIGGTSPYIAQWYFNGSLVGSGMELQNVLPGEYIAEIIDANGCILKQEVVVGFVTGLEEAIWAKDLQIYPNPSTGLIYIDFGKIRKADLKVFNALGELVYDYTGVPFGKKEINLSEMAAGVYLVRIASANDIVYRKITIE